MTEGFATEAMGVGAAGSAFAPVAGPLLAVAGLVSSSAMIRRNDARISSMEGSWTFAGWLMSDSTSSILPQRLGLRVLDMHAAYSLVRSFTRQERVVPKSGATHGAQSKRVQHR